MTLESTPARKSSVPSAAVAGRYELVEAIGSGGAASVYRARDRVLGRDVAVKIFRAESAMPEDLVRQEREIRMLSALSHPGLINVFDAGRQNIEGTLRRFLVMELVPNSALEERMKDGPLPPHEVASIGAQIADALAYVHAEGVIHRDIKPANILVSDVGSGGFRRMAKLGDFGIAHYIDGNRLTSDGTILGTAAYLSPEQVSGDDVGPASDVYSLGLVLLEALTGEQEYKGSVIDAAIARLNHDPRIPDDLAEEWQELVRRMTARAAAERPTAAEVSAILHGKPTMDIAAGGRQTRRGGSGSRVHRRAAFVTLRARRRRNVAMASAVVLLALLACGLSFWLGELVAR